MAAVGMVSERHQDILVDLTSKTAELARKLDDARLAE